MKKCFATIFFLVAAACSFAQTSELKFSIAPWFNNKKAAVSLTFDDGIKGQFEIAVPLLNQYGFKGTFFVTVNTVLKQMGNWELVKSAAATGHEIANHSMTHPHFDKISTDSIKNEIIESNAQIDQHIPFAKHLTHAYPFGEGGQETIEEQTARAVIKKYFIGARATRNKPVSFNLYNFANSEDDYFKINSQMIADSTSMAGFDDDVDTAIAAGGWYSPTYHGIENGWLIVPAKIFKNHLETLEKRKASLWIATFAEVLKYHRERNCAVIKKLSENKHTLTLLLSDTLMDAATWNQPLTVNLIDGSKKIKTIKQAGKNIPFTKAGDTISFNALPGKEQIVIKKY